MRDVNILNLHLHIILNIANLQPCILFVSRSRISTVLFAALMLAIYSWKKALLYIHHTPSLPFSLEECLPPYILYSSFRESCEQPKHTLSSPSNTSKNERTNTCRRHLCKHDLGVARFPETEDGQVSQSSCP